MAAARVPYLLGHAEIASLFGVERQTSRKWRTDGTLPEPDLVASGNPYWLLLTVLRLAGTGGRRVTTDRLEAYRQSLPHGYELQARDKLPPIVGTKEAGLVLGRNAQTIARWRDREQIAPADLVLSRSPLWLLDSLLADARTRGRDVDNEELQLLLAGQRPEQQSRGRPPSVQTTRKTPKPLAASRVFTSEQQADAVAFLHALLSEGFTVVIRPQRRGA
ncbi:hypothetical protein [Planotetraspora sp. GP83]|uniref:hypothetical protein n=1 Tax=Planotetraspora sp. GP83 TaxID=3156264 RepID=UPI003514B448